MKKGTTTRDLVVAVAVAQRTTIHVFAVISMVIHKESLDQAHLNLLMQFSVEWKHSLRAVHEFVTSWMSALMHFTDSGSNVKCHVCHRHGMGGFMALVSDKMKNGPSAPSKSSKACSRSLHFPSFPTTASTSTTNDGEMVVTVLHLPADYPFNLGVFLVLLLPEPTLAVIQAVLVLQEDLTGLLLLGQQPPLVLLQLLVGHHQTLLQGVDLVLVLLHLGQGRGDGEGGREGA